MSCFCHECKWSNTDNEIQRGGSWQIGLPWIALQTSSDAYGACLRTDTGADGDMTDSGYPSQVREWTLAMHQSLISFCGGDVGISMPIHKCQLVSLCFSLCMFFVYPPWEWDAIYDSLNAALIVCIEAGVKM